MEYPLQDSLPVAILGATGAVGQKAVALIRQHPRLHVAELVASPAKAGKLYGDVVEWREPAPLSLHVARLPLLHIDQLQAGLVISALPSEVAFEVEPMLAKRGHLVFSNASAWRQDPAVPLLIPEINSDHLCLLNQQAWSGKLVTNPNCAAVMAALALAPINRVREIQRVHVVTLQAVSGAGYGAYSAMDLMGNLIPHIAGEEEKIETELPRILGTPQEPAAFSVHAQVHRVPVRHGHTVALQLELDAPLSRDDLEGCFRQYNQDYPGLFSLYDHPDFPQPVRHIGDYDQGIHVGRLRATEDRKTVSLVAMGHNLVRGAAGAAIANLEATLMYFEEQAVGTL